MREIAFFHHQKCDGKLYAIELRSISACNIDDKPAVCSDCGAVFHEDHWTWDTCTCTGNETLCPACLRIQDRLPAAILTVRGDCLQDHRDEIMGLIRDKIKKVENQHPLKRIMDMENTATEVVFTFTDEQLTREIGDALHKAYDGVLDYQYNSTSSVLSIIWQR